MRNVFDPEGPVMVALGKLADLVICNILFVLCSLPVFTLGASLTALYRCTLSIVEDTEESLIFRRFSAKKHHPSGRTAKGWCFLFSAYQPL